MLRNQIEINLCTSPREPEQLDYITTLQSQISVLKEAIASQQTTIEKRLEEVQHFEQALLSIQKFPNVKNFTTLPVPALKQLMLKQWIEKYKTLQEARAKEMTLQEARAKEVTLRRSLAISKVNLHHERLHLTKLQQELTKKQTDLDWELNYKHLALKYLSGYAFPPPLPEKPEESLDSLKSQIEQCQQDIIYWQQQVKKPRSSLSAMANPERSLLSVLVRLEQLQKARKKKQTQLPSNPDPLQNEGFREYVRHRVAIDSTVGDFIQAQSDYQKALDQFRAIALHHEQALDFRLSQLENPLQVAIADGKIILRNSRQKKY